MLHAYNVYTYLLAIAYSNPSFFYRQIVGYQRGVDDHRVGKWWNGVLGQIGVQFWMSGPYLHRLQYTFKPPQQRTSHIMDTNFSPIWAYATVNNLV